MCISLVGDSLSCEKRKKKESVVYCAGGHIGFDKVLWEAREVIDSNGPSVQFTYHSHDGEQGTIISFC